MDYNISKTWPLAIKDASDVQPTIELMEKILEPIRGNTRFFSYYFNFSIGNMDCSGNDKKEFLREIFGLTDFRFTSISISVRPKKRSLKLVAQLYLAKYSDLEISMFSDSKDILREIERSYDRCINEITNPSAKSLAIGTYIDNSQHVSVNGDINQSVIGNNNTVTDSCQKDSHIEQSTQEGKNSFWRPVLQSLTANFIWWMIGLICSCIVLVIIAYLKSK